MESTPSDAPNVESQNQTYGGVQNVRLKTDPAWKHCTIVAATSTNKRGLKCLFCNKTFYGGGINRMKQHLAGKTGDILSCKKVPQDVRFEMKSLLEDTNKKDKSSPSAPVLNSGFGYDLEEMGDIGGSKNKRKISNTTITGYLKAGAGIDSSQPSITSVMQTKERVFETDMAIALWFYDACIPTNAVNSPYYQPAISRIAIMGHGYKGPTYHALRVTLLREAKKELELAVNNMRSNWVKFGCTIMGDGWTDVRNRSLINFLVYSPCGISFIKSVDVSDIESNAENLCNLFAEIVEMVGPKNVVHLVTDNAANYKASGRLLNERYPTIFWFPCSAHCINLILKDMGELPIVGDLVDMARRVTIFVYNHKWPLAFLRRRPKWTEIIRPATTRFGTSFIALDSLYKHKADLEALVINEGFKKFLKTAKGIRVKDVVLDSKFWNNCLAIVKVMTPLMKLLRICDTDSKPSLPYVYEGLLRAIKGVKDTFKNNATHYSPYINIIDNRWDKMLRENLHVAAFWLNPTFQYDPNSGAQEFDVQKGMIEIIQRLLPGVPGMPQEIATFRDQLKTFGTPFAKENANSTRPDEWWKLIGGDAPNLQNIAVKILSQTSSSSGCERNWSVFERIHTKKRNRLEHQRLNDLVYVHYNLRLRNRGKMMDLENDPIDYESIDQVEDWIVDEESGELDHEELEEMLASEGIGGEEMEDDQIDLTNLNS